MHRSSSQSRPPAVAGAFYPGDPGRLAAEVDRLLAAAPPPRTARAPKALIVPHAGYVYSGPVAAAGYAQLRPAAAWLRRVVLLGPAHRAFIPGLALPDAEVLETPLGPVPVDLPSVARLDALRQVSISNRVHAREHALEVQLPFLQRLLPDFRVVPLAVGDATPAEVAEVIDFLWDGPETLFVVSTDLSHYLSYDAARAVDRATADRILRLDAEPVDHDEACGATAVNGLLLAARRHELRPSLLSLASSGDSAGPREQVVGYGAFAFHEEAPGGTA